MVSKFIFGFWAKQVILKGGLLVLIWACFSNSTTDRKVDYEYGPFWLALVLIILLLLSIASFVRNEYKQLTITETGIKVSYLLRNKTDFIDFNDIIRFSQKRITSKQGAGRTPGYHILEIHLTNDRIFVISQDLYENYTELRNCIYRNSRSK